MDWAALGTLILLNIVGSLSPGPDTFFLLRLATRSRIHAIMGVTGIVTGLTVWVTLTVVGAATLLTTYPDILSVIQLIGGAYLTWMGYRMGRGAVRELLDARAFRFNSATRPIPDAVAALGTPGQAYRQGVATNLSNPKVIMYFAAILAPLMPANPSLAVALTIIIAIVVQTWVVFSLMCVIVSTERIRKAVLRAGPVFDGVAAVVFIAVGLTLLYEGTSQLLLG
ncbi:LysE family translocator [Corynebacterium gallinarum]|uniref:LysE family translocator n=1 Tax=Corynebacterium gallinarum TaxID=2762214 RepID=A0A8I0HFS7_9CORY|nr:LysE family translocator [Corynebacterium gallinarum]MBD8029113.1 LysE family translocator [Corynebacterium gallinarum]